MTTTTDTRARLWPAIRAAAQRPEGVTAAEARKELKAPLPGLSTVRGYLYALEAAGILRRSDYRPSGLVLATDPGPEAPRVTSAGTPNRAAQRREALWRTLWILRGGFTHTELAAAASTDKVFIRSTIARRYCRGLAAAGYLRLGPPRIGACTYVPVPARKTGPLPPIVHADGTVTDPNAKEARRG